MSAGDPAGATIETNAPTFFEDHRHPVTGGGLGLECQAPVIHVAEAFDDVVRELSNFAKGNDVAGWPVFTVPGTDDEKVAVNPANVISVRVRIDDWSNLA